jgi:hypothetical protein
MASILGSIVQTYSKLPTVETRIDFATNYKETIPKQLLLRFTAPNTGLSTVQSTIGYTFSNAQVLIDALSRWKCGTGSVATIHWTEEHLTTQNRKPRPIKEAGVYHAAPVTTT